jgi:signal transduction histidine kinase
VQQVILNLIRNALDAMRDAGTVDRRVSIETRETETHGIEVIVQDTGPGISPGLRDQAFEQFFTSKDDGLGMGLAISQSIIEAHGGRIWFASPPGGGARVHITLPPNATEPDHA